MQGLPVPISFFFLLMRWICGGATLGSVRFSVVPGSLCRECLEA